MFKKPPSNMKTSAPLRTSDRRKLRQRVAAAFALAPADADALVPDGLLATKYTTHLDEPGILYLAPDGEPLWLAPARGPADGQLVPTVYALWRAPRLLPTLATPPAVVPILAGGADLMIPGVAGYTQGLKRGQLVAVTQYPQADDSPPLAVGVMAVDGSELDQSQKGKAVIVLHVWQDQLWALGSKAAPPELGATEATKEANASTATPSSEGEASEARAPDAETSEADAAPEAPLEPTYTPEEVSKLLRGALLQALSTTLGSLPPSAFPIPASTFYTTHILPARPASATASTPIDIKHSTYKSLATFLRAAEKDGLLRLKDNKPDAAVAAVVPAHTDVAAHRLYTTLAAAEAKRERAAAAAEAAQRTVPEIDAVELWKPHQHTAAFFAGAGHSAAALYTFAQLKDILAAYVAAHGLANAHAPQYVNADAALRAALAPPAEFVRRDEAARLLAARMQAWHAVGGERRKGPLKPVVVAAAVRQGRRAATRVVGFEAFGLAADALADELRKLCASATSVAPLAGKGAGVEVLVQGRHLDTVAELLRSKGVPKRWIEVDKAGRK